MHVLDASLPPPSLGHLRQGSMSRGGPGHQQTPELQDEVHGVPLPLEERVQRPPCSLRLLHHLMDQACSRHLTTGVRWKRVELGCLRGAASPFSPPDPHPA